MSGMPLPASVAFNAVIHVCHAWIHVLPPSSVNVVDAPAVPASRGSAAPHSPCNSAGDAESKKIASYSPAATCAASESAQYESKPALLMFISSLPSALLATRVVPDASCQNQSSCVVTV